MKKREFSVLEAFFILILVGITLAFYNIISPFLIDIFFAILFTHLFYKLFMIFRDKFSRHVSAVFTVLAAFITILVPLLITGFLAGIEAAKGVSLFRGGLSYDSINRIMVWLKTSGVVEQLGFDWQALDLEGQIGELLSQATNVAFNVVSQTLLNTTASLLHVIMILVLMYFFLMTGHELLRDIKTVLPFNETQTDQLVNEIIKMVDATILGTFIVGFIEGVFGGVIFWMFGMPSPIIWGVIMVFISIIPIIGTNSIIWPAGVIMIINGYYVQGIVMIILGFIGISITQHILKPKLLGDRSGVHPVLVLLSLLGGIFWLGPIGLVMGPILMALFIVLWKQFASRYSSELRSR